MTIFFVLSGFVLGKRDTATFAPAVTLGDLRRVLQSRLARIYPLHLLVLVLLVALAETGLSGRNAGDTESRLGFHASPVVEPALEVDQRRIAQSGRSGGSPPRVSISQVSPVLCAKP